MTKGDLIDAMSEKTGVSKAASKRFLDAFTETITESLTTGDKVTLTGFGVFFAAERKSRTGRNPRTGAEIRIPAGRTPKFKPGKMFKDKVS